MGRRLVSMLYRRDVKRYTRCARDVGIVVAASHRSHLRFYRFVYASSSSFLVALARRSGDPICHLGVFGRADDTIDLAENWIEAKCLDR